MAGDSQSGVAGFRLKLFAAILLVVTAVTTLGLFFAQRRAAAGMTADFQREFQQQMASIQAVEDVRQAILAERCRALSRRSRIHAALEDGAPDLLYPNARDDMADVMYGEGSRGLQAPDGVLHAAFYRFLDARGAVIPPVGADDAGRISVADEAVLALEGAPDGPETGYLPLTTPDGRRAVDELVAMPIVSTETGEAIATVVLGFQTAGLADGGEAGIVNGIWVNGTLCMPSLAGNAAADLAGEMRRTLASGAPPKEIRVAGTRYLLFYKQLNPGSLYPPAYRVCLYPLAGILAREGRLAWQFAGAGLLLLLGAIGAGHYFSTRLSVPVEKLAADSEENRMQRLRAEIALEHTSRELERSARFSADASHQLKTPITVLRAGLEELLAGESLAPEMREEVSALVHQTFRLTNVIEDLLLLSRMDAGRLRLELAPVSLAALVEGWLDDLGALPDPLQLRVETDLPAGITILGERRYTALIVQNMLENARKYNRPGGRIRVSVRAEGGQAVLSIGNTGRPIPAAARERIFERFHRGGMGENVPGHGLGLNLARELARLHGGELRLLRSDESWTEFEVRFRLSGAPAPETSKAS